MLIPPFFINQVVGINSRLFSIIRRSLNIIPPISGKCKGGVLRRSLNIIPLPGGNKKEVFKGVTSIGKVKECK